MIARSRVRHVSSTSLPAYDALSELSEVNSPCVEHIIHAVEAGFLGDVLKMSCTGAEHIRGTRAHYVIEPGARCVAP